MLRDGAGRPVALGARLGRGGEGEVFEVVGRPDLAAKVLHSGRAAGKAEKIRRMVDRVPAGACEVVEGYPVLTWPRGVLVDATRGRVVGYTMPRVLPQDFVPFFRVTTAARRKGIGGAALTWDRQLLLASRLCHLVRTLHGFGYAVGDLNDRNVLVSRRLTPLLMDTDSFQVPRPGWGHHPCVVGDPLYWPPELLDVDLSRHKGNREPGDRFALGVLLFQLFMDGLRPYQARGALVEDLETVAQKTRAGHYPWAHPRPGLAEPPAGAPSYAALPQPLRDAFERCFVEGHRRPARRPSAEEWHALLRRLLAQGFRTCTRDAAHVFGAGQAACPWCGDPNDRYAAAPRRNPAAVGRPRVARKGRNPSLTKPRQATKATMSGGRTAVSPTPRAGRPEKPVPRNASATGTPVRSPRRPKRASLPRARSKAAGHAKPRPARAEAGRARARKRRTRGGAWPLRAAWLALVAAALLAPALLLAKAPDGTDKQAVAGLSALALVGGGGAAGAWRVSPQKVRVPALWAWGTVTACAAAAVAASQAWSLVLPTAGVGWALAGTALFAWLEARDATPFHPDAGGWLHAAASLPVATLPLAALWLHRAFA